MIATRRSSDVAMRLLDGNWFNGGDTGVVVAAPACPACVLERRRQFDPGDGDRPAVTSPEAAADLLVPMLAGRDREHCAALVLDTKHRVIDAVPVSAGSVDHTFMAPREIFRDALLVNGSAVVLGHNHPSGDPEPSRDDEQVTGRLVRAGELVGVEVLDHLIVAGSRWVSLARRGSVRASTRS
jgi:DNA repair protein RadC